MCTAFWLLSFYFGTNRVAHKFYPPFQSFPLSLCGGTVLIKVSITQTVFWLFRFYVGTNKAAHNFYAPPKAGSPGATSEQVPVEAAGFLQKNPQHWHLSPSLVHREIPTSAQNSGQTLEMPLSNRGPFQPT